MTPPQRPTLPAAFGRGTLAALQCTVMMFAARLVFDTPTLPELATEFTVRLLPGPLFSWLIDTLGGDAKRLLLVGLLAAQCVAGGLASIAYYRSWRLPALPGQWPPPTPLRAGLSGALAWATLVWLAVMLLVLPVWGHGPFGAAMTTRVSYPLTSWLVFLTYGYSLHAFATLGDRFVPLEGEGPGEAGRRRVLGGMLWGGAAVFSLGALGVLLREFGRLASFTSTAPPAGLPHELTPVADFYHVSKNLTDPVVQRESWSLRVDGLVNTPFTARYGDLTAMGSQEQYATLHCISNATGGNLISNGQWRGVPLRSLLERAGLRPGVEDVVFTCADGYTDSIPLAKALEPGTLLVYEQNGEPLTPEHGFPARVLVPGIYGMKNAKWVTMITAVDTDYEGYWQRQGWDDAARYQTWSRIDVPSKGAAVAAGLEGVTVAGVAFAGDRGISRVDVSSDDGQTWLPATLRPPLGPLTWVLWECQWYPPRPGNYTLRVRATDGAGEPQTAEVAFPFPRGATGHHQLAVTVTPAVR